MYPQQRQQLQVPAQQVDPQQQFPAQQTYPQQQFPNQQVYPQQQAPTQQVWQASGVQLQSPQFYSCPPAQMGWSNPQ
jgi:UPF0755 protein